MKPGDKFAAQGTNPPQGGKYLYDEANDEFECVEAPQESEGASKEDE